MIAVTLCAGLGLVFWWLHASTRDLRNSVAAADAALIGMRSDAEAITSMRHAPPRALDEARPSEQLLSQVDDALAVAGIPKALWRDSVPMPAQRDADGQFVRHTTRLYFEGVSMRQVTELIHVLLTRDPVLRITAIQVSARDKQGTWSAEMAVSYRVYVPQI